MATSRKTTKTVPASTKNPRGAATGTTRPRQKKGPVLDIAPIPVERVPSHNYGMHRHVAELANGDVLYLGTPQKLSTAEVVKVLPDGKGPTKGVFVEVLALDLLIDGVRYTGREQVLLAVDTNTRLGVAMV